MRNAKKMRSNGSAKNVAKLTVRRRQVRKRNAALKRPSPPKILEFIAPTTTELPVVKTPPSRIGSLMPFLFWLAFPIATMHMWLGTNTGVRE